MPPTNVVNRNDPFVSAQLLRMQLVFIHICFHTQHSFLCHVRTARFSVLDLGSSIPSVLRVLRTGPGTAPHSSQEARRREVGDLVGRRGDLVVRVGAAVVRRAQEGPREAADQWNMGTVGDTVRNRVDGGLGEKNQS